MKARQLGLWICLLGSAAAVLFPPYEIIGGVRWGFVLSPIVQAFGRGVYVYEHIAPLPLLVELVLINAAGLALMSSGRRRRRRRR